MSEEPKPLGNTRIPLELNEQLHFVASDSRDIAVVGMACRLPDANSVFELWDNILEKRLSFRSLEGERWNHSSHFSAERRAVNATSTESAALVEDIQSFAAGHFRISPKRARHMDPQQRLALEVSREALQDAGLERRPWAREDSAVFYGVNLSEYGNLLSTPLRRRQIADGQFGLETPIASDACQAVIPANSYTLLGSNISMCASCVAQEYDCGGPALVLDAACAAGMAAVVQGVQYLRTLPASGAESPIAIVGGVYLLLVPDNAVCFSKLGALARSECRPFDVRSDGFLLGEGAVTLVLKRAADARRDGDQIHALIKGVAWNNDGSSASPATPSQSGQMRVMRAGMRDAQFPAESIDYVECHGTGTEAGDPIELASLNEVFGKRETELHLGSIKANIGHTLAASGPAGLLRAILALKRGIIPPQAGWEKWHPELEALAKPFHIPTEAMKWTSEQKRAVVSSFAFGGTNCFVAFEEERQARESSSPAEELLFCFSASSFALLQCYVGSLRPHIDSLADIGSLARTLWTRNFDKYVAIIRTSKLEALKRNLGILQELSECPQSPGELGNELLVGPTTSILEFDSGWKSEVDLLSTEYAPNKLTGGSGPLITIPPVPLERKQYWFTKTKNS